MKLADVPVPDSPSAGLCLQVAERYYSPALLNHCLRSYFFAAAAGVQRGIAFDPELLYVAAVLHDLGLTEPFDSHSVPFEAAGAEVAWVFAAGAGWPSDRRERLCEVIVRHMGAAVDPQLDAEGHLLEIATGLDIGGRDAGLWPDEFLTEVLRAHPRLDIADEFADRFREQAARKPTSAAADALRNGMLYRLRSNVLGARLD